jgi:hypothetical protein
VTIIVYRDGVLAADSQTTYGNVSYNDSRKVLKSNGHLYGSSGVASECASFMKWAKTQNGPIPYMRKGNGLAITPAGKIMLVGQGSNEFREIYSDYYCIGNGEDVALGALYMGATAIEAVKAAIEHNIYCGGKVLSVKL